MIILRLLLIVIVLVALVYYTGKLLLEMKKKKEGAYTEEEEPRTSTDKDIHAKQKYCYTQIEENEAELLKIEKDIRELKEDLKSFYATNPENIVETEKLIEAFEKEKSLRELKIDFFRDCLRKLGTIRHNHRVTQRLFAKKERLKTLREKDIEDVANLESFKTELIYSEEYLKNIDLLSRRMYRSDSLHDAETVREELKLISQELKRL